MSYLISIAIGPVQEFIATARRSRDLWFGSWLLSELSKAAANAIVKHQNHNLNPLIFPAPKAEGDLESFTSFNVANKILAKVSGNLRSIVETVRQSVIDRLDQATREAFSHIQAEEFDPEIMAWTQVRDLLEFYWVAVEVEEDTDSGIKDYATKRAQIEALLAARKMTRHFAPPPWTPSRNPKSSLDGQRESVIPEEAYKPRTRGGWEWSDQKLRSAYGVRKGERLCGVGLLKRHGMRGENLDRFPSTSHVASLSLMECFNNADPQKVREYRQALNNYLQTLRHLRVSNRDMGFVYGPQHPVFGIRDGHLLFSERLHEFVEEANVKPARKALKDFLDTTVNKQPIPYYALLHADGDRMGKVIDYLETEKLHRQLSQVLAHFASNVGAT